MFSFVVGGFLFGVVWCPLFVAIRCCWLLYVVLLSVVVCCLVLVACCLVDVAC